MTGITTRSRTRSPTRWSSTPGTVVSWVATCGLIWVASETARLRGDVAARAATRPETFPDLHEVYDEVRARGPVVKAGLVHVTASYDATGELLRDRGFATVSPARDNPLGHRLARLLERWRDPLTMGVLDPPSLLAIDAPEHTRYRRLVARVFTPKAVMALTPDIETLAGALLDDMAVSGGGGETVDLVSSYASLLPIGVIGEILGIPPAMGGELLAMGEGAAASLDPGLGLGGYRRAEADIRRMNLVLADHITSLRASPGEDLLSRLTQLEEDGDRLSDLELRATALLLLAAGFETTVNLIGNAVVRLLAHPEQLHAAIGSPSLWAGVVEESLRFDPPVRMTVRRAVGVTPLLGVPVPAGGRVVALLGAANRDPAVFEDPHTFDSTRANAREHLAFSGGAHFCLGAHLARLEATIALRMLFERFPHLAAAGEPEPRRTSVVNGFVAIPVRLS